LIYEKVLSLAADRGMSISELEKKAGLSKASISKWKKSSPTAGNLKAVAKVLHVKVDKLLE
jgi:transcriptional regulator with XRE-family HTH domain